MSSGACCGRRRWIPRYALRKARLQTEGKLPFITVFIFCTFLSGLLLPRLRYPKGFFFLGGALVLVGGGLQHTVTTESSEASVMGFEAVIGAGVGLMWSISLPISSAVLHPRDHMDTAVLFNLAQMGGVSISLAISGVIYEKIHGFLGSFP